MEGEESTPMKSPSSSLSRQSTLGRPSPSSRLRSPSLNSVHLRHIFDIFDHNRDGEITIEELSLALDRLGLGADPDEIASIVSAHIRSGRSGLEFADFVGLHSALGESLFGASAAGEINGVEAAVAEEETDMEEAFRVFDEDGDGYISAEELQAVLEKLGLPEARCISRVNEMICSVDRNRDGRVDFLEFKHMMQGISVRSS